MNSWATWPENMRMFAYCRVMQSEKRLFKLSTVWQIYNLKQQLLFFLPMDIQTGKGSGDSSSHLHMVTTERAQMGLQNPRSVWLTHGAWMLVVSGLAGNLSWKINCFCLSGTFHWAAWALGFSSGLITGFLGWLFQEAWVEAKHLLRT